MRALFFSMVLAAHAIFACTFAIDPSLAQTDAGAYESPIGKVLTVIGDVTVEHEAIVVVQAKLTSGPTATSVGDFVYRGDTVQTGRDGKVGIALVDGTALNLTPNARMVLNEFVYDPNGKSNATLFSLSKGSMTFVAGAIAKTGNMKLDTPVATMGIRGTTPRVEIADDGTVRFSTLIEEDKITEPQPGGGQNLQPAPPDRRRASRSSRDGLSTEEAAKYNKLFDMDLKICRNC